MATHFEDTPTGGMELSPSKTHQFSLKSILWMTIAFCLLLSYASWWGKEALIHAIVFASIGLSIGFLVGIMIGHWQESVFWSLLIALLAYLAVEGGRMTNLATFYGWGAVGATCGSLGPMRRPKSLWISACMLGALSSAVMVVCLLAFRESITGLAMFDVLSAALIGAILRPFLLFLQWFEHSSQQPRYVLASWLTMSVLIGNFLVPILGGVQR